MDEVREDVVEQLEKHQETMRLDDFVRIVERHHSGGEPGVARDLLADYADAVYFDVDLSAIDDRLTDSAEWVEGREFYEVGRSPEAKEGRVSVYPPDWHRTLSDTDDVREVIEVIQTEVTEPEGDAQEAVTEEKGVPEEKVLRVAEAVAGIDRETTRDRIEELRKDGEIEEFASQHRNPTIRLS